MRWNTNTTGHEHASPSTGYWLATTLEAEEACSTQCPTRMTNASAQAHHVTVGAGNTLTFTPNELDAGIRDIVKFTFLALHHTLTQSSLELPCTNLGGFSTGFNQFNPKNISGEFIVEYAVRTLDPQWFFCAQTKAKSHCQAGMVFALNPGDKMGNFLSAAAQTLTGEKTSTKEIAQTPTASASSAEEKISGVDVSIGNEMPTSTSENANVVSTTSFEKPVSTTSRSLNESFARPSLTVSSHNNSPTTEATVIPASSAGRTSDRRTFANTLTVLLGIAVVFLHL